MASRVCISCGLTTDDQGRLIANTGDAVWPYGCPETNGVPIVCGADGVLRLGQPEKFHTRNIQYSGSLSGQADSATFGSPTPGGAAVDFGAPLVYVLNNPSSCLPMTVASRHGIHHCALGKTGAGDAFVLYGTRLTVSGGIVAVTDAHQAWRHNGSVTSITFDTMNSTRTDVYTLAAGGAATFTAQRYILVTGTTNIPNLTSHVALLDVDAWN